MRCVCYRAVHGGVGVDVSMAQMAQEKFEETIGFEIKTLISHIPVKLGSTAEKGKKVDDYKVEHDTDKQQVYELRVRI
jgi:hypothetical protein